MRISKIFALVVIASLTFAACEKDDVGMEVQHVLNGNIAKQDSSSTELGTHTIQDFQLESSTFELDDYLDRTVVVFGNSIGDDPKHIEVIDIK